MVVMTIAPHHTKGLYTMSNTDKHKDKVRTAARRSRDIVKKWVDDNEPRFLINGECLYKDGVPPTWDESFEEHLEELTGDALEQALDIFRWDTDGSSYFDTCESDHLGIRLLGLLAQIGSDRYTPLLAKLCPPLDHINDGHSPAPGVYVYENEWALRLHHINHGLDCKYVTVDVYELIGIRGMNGRRSIKHKLIMEGDNNISVEVGTHKRLQVIVKDIMK